MAVVLDLADIQGNILAGYGKQGFPIGRCILFHIGGADPETRAANGRRFVEALRPRVTSALRWDDDKPRKPGEYIVKIPEVALNVAFTFHGLLALGVPTRTLRAMPDPFIDGMASRARLLGDDFAGGDWRGKWDEVWQASNPDPACDPKTPHILVTLNARADTRGQMDAVTAEIEAAARDSGVSLLTGHNPRGAAPARYQELAALLKPNGEPARTEHFGFADGISDPVFEGQYLYGEEQLEAAGNGAVDGEGKWLPLATGEFLLGYPDDAQETSGPITPIPFFRNGTFMAYRKIHENVKSWRDFIDKAAADFGKVARIDDFDDARRLLIAKMIGRWPDGVPLSKAPTIEAHKAFKDSFNQIPKDTVEGRKARRRMLIDFAYADDPQGLKCPLASHVRRANTRDSLDPRAIEKDPVSRGGSVLNNRRRILRRGLPYGLSGPETSDADEHGVVMLIVCADLFRQFEFVQQQWMNYGLDARAGSDACPIVGTHSLGADTPDQEARERNGPKAKYVVPADPGKGFPPFVVEGLPQFVETRGGEYFFVPSLTALRMIAKGSVDPT
jgi:Dyp-type peroxidase family